MRWMIEINVTRNHNEVAIVQEHFCGIATRKTVCELLKVIGLGCFQLKNLFETRIVGTLVYGDGKNDEWSWLAYPVVLKGCSGTKIWIKDVEQSFD